MKICGVVDFIEFLKILESKRLAEKELVSLSFHEII